MASKQSQSDTSSYFSAYVVRLATLDKEFVAAPRFLLDVEEQNKQYDVLAVN